MALPAPATPPATAPTALAAPPASLPIPDPILFRRGPSSILSASVISLILI